MRKNDNTSGSSSSSSLPKIPFKVVYCTSSDDGHSEHELEKRHSKRGWQSARFCYYPQDLILQFDQEYEVRELRILSHQSKIAAKIHVSVGSGSGVRSTHFTGLGCLTLDPNERSNFKARELKKVHIRAQGNLMKLSVLKSHINRINMFNQVAIIAVQVLGVPKSGSMRPTGSENRDGDGSEKGNRRSSIDEKTQNKIMALKELKARAIEEEDYDKAKKLKLAIEALEKIGPHLAMLEQKKKEAVDREDFDTAMAIKAEIQRIRSGRPAQQPQHSSSQHHPQHMPRQPSGQMPPPGYYPPYDHDVGGPPGSFPPNNMPNNNDGRKNNNNIGSSHAGSFGPDLGPKVAHSFSPTTSNHSLGVGPSGTPAASSHAGVGPTDGGFPVGHHSLDSNPGFPANNPGFPANNPGFPANNSGFPGNAAGYPFPAAGDVGPDAVPPMGGGGQKGLGNSYDPNDERPLPALQKGLEPPGGGGGVHKAPSFDDRPLPTLMKRNNANPEGPLGGDNSGDGKLGEPMEDVDSLEPEPIGEKDRGFAESLIQAFGDKTTACVLDSRFPLRERGLKEIRDMMDSNGAKLFHPLTLALKRLLSDKVPSLISSACALLTHALQTSASGAAGERSVTLLSQLFMHLKSNKARVRKAAMQAVEAMLKHVPAALEKITRKVLKPIERKDLNKSLVLLSVGRILLDILQVHGMNQAIGIELQPVMKQAVILLEHRDSKVRDLGVQVATAVHANMGLRTLKPFLKNLPKGMKDTLEQAFKANTKESGGGETASNNFQTRPEEAKEGNAAADQNEENFEGEDGGELAEEPGYCQFCGFQDPEYENEVKMDMHYWRECPMLICCNMCEEVVEIATYTQHLMEECSDQANYEKCDTCQLAVKKSEMKKHQEMKCVAPPRPEEGSKCPLCFENIPPWEEGWKAHLLERKCPANARTNGTMPPE
eukprot:CAMPEP_0184502940 /NCGR_PEP_ID=MMETSP0113_2-20130426/51578_1 /TAXON_ID=91329 /ORGANISM="Norrisiella sphaerica, Strain BC52" /LENGTH=937 /DNA_ID=CAMNT_0026892315 /DNA_START=100 /DNA_END=2913 /DNA_ORIENTATION=-